MLHGASRNLCTNPFSDVMKMSTSCNVPMLWVQHFHENKFLLSWNVNASFSFSPFVSHTPHETLELLSLSVYLCDYFAYRHSLEDRERGEEETYEQQYHKKLVSHDTSKKLFVFFHICWMMRRRISSSCVNKSLSCNVIDEKGGRDGKLKSNSSRALLASCFCLSPRNPFFLPFLSHESLFRSL